MSRWEFLLWGLDFMIGGVGYFLGGPYAGALCFVFGGVSILIGFLKKEADENSREPTAILFDHNNQPYRYTRTIRAWHKWGAVSFGLMVVALICYGALHGWPHLVEEEKKHDVTAISKPDESYSSSHSAASDTPNSSDDSQYALLRLSPQKKKELTTLKAPLFRDKAAVLDSPQHYNYERARDTYRTELESVEEQCGCLIDTEKVECLPKPPTTITRSDVDISISAKMVADDLAQTFFWVIKDNVAKVRVPIVLYVSLSNQQPIPLKIDLIYLDAKSIGGWADIRMADTTIPDELPMSRKPLVLQGKNAAMSVKGEYLLPSLYNRILQPGGKAEGWIIAEYPRGIKYGNSIADMRISIHTGEGWIASKTFPANPRVYENQAFDSFYLTPLDTLITEDW